MSTSAPDVTRAPHQKALVIIFGPPAVGKMTVGHALSQRTGLPLLHNHLTIDLLLRFFPYEHPSFRRLSGEFRVRLFEELAAAPEYAGLIFTYVWALDHESDRAFVDRLSGIFTSRGGRVCFVELAASLDERLRRNETGFRLAEKESKRDLGRSREHLLDVERRYQMNTGPGAPPFFYPDAHLRLETTAMSPEEAAERIAEYFGLQAPASSCRRE